MAPRGAHVGRTVLFVLMALGYIVVLGAVIYIGVHIGTRIGNW